MDDPTETLLIFGASGHGRVVADAARAQGRWRHLLAADRAWVQGGADLLPGVPVIALGSLPACGSAHVAIGNAAWREREALALGVDRLVSVIDPRASVSPEADVEAGSFVAAMAVVATAARLGRCVIVNHGAVVDHDCEVGAYTHVAPQAALGGGAVLGARVLLGSGARLLPGVRVCDDVVVGAGAVVYRDITTPGVYAGVPARKIK